MAALRRLCRPQLISEGLSCWLPIFASGLHTSQSAWCNTPTGSEGPTIDCKTATTAVSPKTVVQTDPAVPTVTATAAKLEPQYKTLTKEQRMVKYKLKLKPTAAGTPPTPLMPEDYEDNKQISEDDAVIRYCLLPADLEKLPRRMRRSGYFGEEHEVMYLKSDCEGLAVKKFGSNEAMIAARNREIDKLYKIISEGFPQSSGFRSHERNDVKKESMTEGAGKVVLFAIVINGSICFFKFVGWWMTGSHCMFSEGIHSLADMLNQGVLAVGIYQSTKKPDSIHPYGYSNVRYLASFASGAFFFFGAGISVYQGVTGLFHPVELQPLSHAFVILLGSFMLEAASLYVAARELRIKAKHANISFFTFVRRAVEPSLNVVFLEDLAAVCGVGIAAAFLGLSSYFNSHIPDAVGSILIGLLLGSASTFIIKTNGSHLVGLSIPAETLRAITMYLENDPMVRSVTDVKGVIMGVNQMKLKAELEFDGRNITRAYLETLRPGADEDSRNPEDFERFLLTHGEGIIDRLGIEIDRIEKELKEKFPECRHVDLEPL